MLQRERVLRKHPRLQLIAAHWAGAAGDRTYLEEMLEKYPNMYTEGGAHQPKVEFATLDSAELSFFDRYQDQVMFGTDYMENTFRWLKSYRQRLDMFLPFTEKWPLPDSVMAKYYHGNARRLARARRRERDAHRAPGIHVDARRWRHGHARREASYAARGPGAPVPMAAGGRAARSADSRTPARRHRSLRLTVADSRVRAHGDARVRRRAGPRGVRVNVIAAEGQFVEDGGRVDHRGRALREQHAARRAELDRRARPRRILRRRLRRGRSQSAARSCEPASFERTRQSSDTTSGFDQPGTYVVYARGAGAR